jgi:hypothetical protein
MDIVSTVEILAPLLKLLPPWLVERLVTIGTVTLAVVPLAAGLTHVLPTPEMPPSGAAITKRLWGLVYRGIERMAIVTDRVKQRPDEARRLLRIIVDTVAQAGADPRKVAALTTLLERAPAEATESLALMLDDLPLPNATRAAVDEMLGLAARLRGG